MKNYFFVSYMTALCVFFTLVSCSVQEENAPTRATTAQAPAKTDAKASAEKAPEKTKVEKVGGDVGLIDTEKNYMILVTKEGKLVTLDFAPTTKVRQIAPAAAKIADVGLGSSATITYTEEKGKNVATQLEYKPAKAGE